MFLSVDTLSVCNTIRQIPAADLAALGFKSIKSKKLDSLLWYLNSPKGKHFPNLTIYQTYHKKTRLRITLSIPKFLNGNNIQLPTGNQIYDSFGLVTEFVEKRLGIFLDVRKFGIERIDYALNLEKPDVKKIIERYAKFRISKLKIEITGDGTVYFKNKSSCIAIYDKFAYESKSDLPLKVKKLAQGIVRAEYRLLNRASFQRFAKKFNFGSTSAEVACSDESLNIVFNVFSDLLKLKTLENPVSNKIKTAFEYTKDMKKAQSLVGFVEAYENYGEQLHLNRDFNFSLVTFKRRLQESIEAGLI